MRPDESYDAKLAAIVRRLRLMADDIERVGRVGQDLGTGLPDHLTPALSVMVRLDTGVRALMVEDLILQAVRADHATARLSPAQLLDRGATAVQLHLYGSDEPDPTLAGPDPVRTAEAVLRGAEVLR